jgi:hypothetical protein
MRRQTYRRDVQLLALIITIVASSALVKAQSPPNGPAGGDLSGTYPNPVLGTDRVRKVGDTMTGALDIKLNTSGGLVYPFSLSATGTAAASGVAMKFNVPLGINSSMLGGQLANAWGANGQTFLSFSAYNNGAFSEIARLDGTGRFGIGTTNPSVQLHINNATAPGTFLMGGAGGGLLTLQDANAAVNAKFYQLRSEGGVFRLSLINDAWSGFINQNILVANSSGNIGIGTATPLQKLQIGVNTSTATATPDSLSLGATYSNTAGANPKLRMYDDNAGVLYGLGVSAQQFDLMAPAAARYVWNLGGVEKMRLDSNGNLGIGTSAPNSLSKLDVNGQIRATSYVLSDGTPIGGGGGGTITGVTAGLGLTGGGTSGAVPLNVGAGTGVSVTADTISVNYGPTAGTAVQGNTLLTVSALPSAGISVSGGAITLGSGGTVTLDNTDKGSAQLFFKNISNGTTQISATANNDTLTITGGGGTTVSVSNINNNKTITIDGSTSNISAAKVTEGTFGSGDYTFPHNVTVNGNIAAKYQDLAEWVESSQELTAATVVVLDTSKSNQVIASTQPYDSRIAGVISSSPGIALGEQTASRVLVATTGRVKVKVDASNGPIQIGDLLVTSDKPGVAMKSIPVEVVGVRMHRPGTLIGKALEPLAGGTGEILVLLSLQ